MSLKILVRGGGDLASGVIARCYRAGWSVLVTELPQPLSVRRLVSFSQAIYSGSIEIEGIPARRCDSLSEALDLASQKVIPVMVDPDCTSMDDFLPDVVVDARMTKRPPESARWSNHFTIGLGPGFSAGESCHAVIETVRGPRLGRVIWQGMAENNTGIPDSVGLYREERVLRAPCDGELTCLAEIGDVVEIDQPIARVGDAVVKAPFKGVLRGLLVQGLLVTRHLKIGDLDPRCDPELSRLISDKALAIGGGVLEAILTWCDQRIRESR